MRKGRFFEEQMLNRLCKAGRDSRAQGVKKYGISEQVIYIWRQRPFELGNLRLKKLLAECDLEIERVKEIAAKRW